MNYCREADDSGFIKLVYDQYLYPKFQEYHKKCYDCLNGIEMVKKEYQSMSDKQLVTY